MSSVSPVSSSNSSNNQQFQLAMLSNYYLQVSNLFKILTLISNSSPIAHINCQIQSEKPCLIQTDATCLIKCHCEVSVTDGGGHPLRTLVFGGLDHQQFQLLMFDHGKFLILQNTLLQQCSQPKTQRTNRSPTIDKKLVMEALSQFSLPFTQETSALLLQGVLLHKMKLFRLAAKHYKMVLERQPSLGSQCHYNIGLCQQSVGEYEEAILSYRQSLDVKPVKEAAINLFMVYLRRGDNHNAYNLYNKYPYILKQSSQCEFNYGLLLKTNNNLVQSRVLYQKMLVRKLSKGLELRIRIILAGLEHKLGNLEGAFGMYAGMRNKAGGKMGDAIELKMRLIELEMLSKQEENIVQILSQPKIALGERGINRIKKQNFFMKEEEKQTRRAFTRKISKYVRKTKESLMSKGMKSTMVASSDQCESPAGGCKEDVIHTFSVESNNQKMSFLSEKRANTFLGEVLMTESLQCGKSVTEYEGLSLEIPVTPTNHEVMEISQVFQCSPQEHLCGQEDDMPPDYQYFESKIQEQQKAIQKPYVQPSFSVMPPPLELKARSSRNIDQEGPSPLIRRLSIQRCNTVKVNISEQHDTAGEQSNILGFCQFLVSKKDYKSTISNLKQLLRITTDITIQYKAHKMLVGVYKQLEMPQKAVIFLRKLLSSNEKQTYVELYKVYLQLGRTDKAIQTIIRGLGVYPKQATFFEQLGWLYLCQNDINNGIDNLEKAYSLNKLSKSLRKKLLHAYFLKPSTAHKCKSLLVDLYENSTEQMDNNEKLVLGLFMEKELPAGLRRSILRQLYSEDQSNNIYHMLMANVQIEQHNLQNGFQHLQQSIMANTQNTKAVVELAKLYKVAEDFDTAQKILKMNAGDGVNPEIEVELGELEFGRGMFELALTHYKKALTVDSYNTTLFNKIANCYCRLKFPWVAIKYYKQSLSIDSSQHEVLVEMANISMNYRDFLKAEKYYSLAESTFGCSFVCSMGRIKCMINRRCYEQALKELAKMSNTFELNEQFINAKATCQFFTLNYEEALAEYSKLEKMNPSDQCYYNMGVCYHKLNDYFHAAECYNKAISINPRHTRALMNYGVIGKEQGRQKQAVLYIKRALDIQFRAEWVMFLVELYCKLNKFHEARSELDRIVDVESFRHKTEYYSVKISAHIDKANKGKALLQKFRQKFASSEYLPQLQQLVEFKKDSMVSLVLESSELE